MGAHADQWQVAVVNALMAVYSGSADMRRAAQLAVQVIGPGMIGAGDRPAKLARLVDKDHAVVAAHILEQVDLAFGVTHYQQRSAEEICGLHAGAWNVLAETDCCPAVAEQGATLIFEHGVIDITRVREPVRRFNGGHYVAKVDHGGHLMPDLFFAESLRRKSVFATQLVHPDC